MSVIVGYGKFIVHWAPDVFEILNDTILAFEFDTVNFEKNYLDGESLMREEIDADPDLLKECLPEERSEEGYAEIILKMKHVSTKDPYDPPEVDTELSFEDVQVRLISEGVLKTMGILDDEEIVQ